MHFQNVFHCTDLYIFHVSTPCQPWWSFKTPFPPFLEIILCKINKTVWCMWSLVQLKSKITNIYLWFFFFKLWHRIIAKDMTYRTSWGRRKNEIQSQNFDITLMSVGCFQIPSFHQIRVLTTTNPYTLVCSEVPLSLPSASSTWVTHTHDLASI